NTHTHTHTRKYTHTHTHTHKHTHTHIFQTLASDRAFHLAMEVGTATQLAHHNTNHPLCCWLVRCCISECRPTLSSTLHLSLCLSFFPSLYLSLLLSFSFFIP